MVTTDLPAGPLRSCLVRLGRAFSARADRGYAGPFLLSENGDRGPRPSPAGRGIPDDRALSLSPGGVIDDDRHEETRATRAHRRG